MRRMLLSNAGRRGDVPQKNFLYDRKGPWPQPSPTEPLGTAPEVLHLPWQEQLDWQWHIGLRYLRDLFIYGPISLVKALGFRELPEIDDEAMASVLTRGLYSRFLSTLDPIDEETFAGVYDPDDGAVYYKLDFTPIESVEPYSGMFVAPTITLMRRESDTSDEFTVVATAVGEQRLVLQPKDEDSWRLAKYYILQGCSYATLFTEHPNVHFPYDTINAVTKGSIPVDHLLFKLLIPHLRFSLVLDNAVLQSKGSVISNFRDTIYDPFTAPASGGLMSFFVAGHKGLPGNSAYPAYRYPSTRDELPLPPTRYGQFLRDYFEPFHAFTTAVVAEMTETELGYCEEWARWIRVWIPSFPLLPLRDVEGDALQLSLDRLAFALAVMLWDVTVVHSTDHQDFAADVPVDYKCFRLRQPAPVEKESEPVDRRALSRKVDQFKSHLAHRMFFAPTNVTLLMGVEYDFQTDALRAAHAAFREQLRTVDASFEDKGIRRYIPIGDVAASIQY
jgi:hypothetical protein